MRIRTQFILTSAIFGIVLIAVAALLVITEQDVARSNQRLALARNIQQRAFELVYIGNDYLVYRESQQAARWKAGFVAFSEALARFTPESEEQQSLVNNIRDGQQRLQAIFVDVEGNTENEQESVASDTAFLRVAWSRMAVQSQGIVFDTTRLEQIADERSSQIQRRNIVLIVILVGVFGAFFMVNYVMINRRVIRSLQDLTSGTKAIGAGNLDFRIQEKKNDEIGDLSRAFNRMTASLKEVTASRAELEQEVSHRKNAEEKMKQSALELEAVNRELEAFAYSVSHDLRAPLRHIQGFARAVVEDYKGKLDSQGTEYLYRIQDAIRQMSELIDGMLTLSRITRLDMQPEVVDLSLLANEIAADLRESEPRRAAEFTVSPGVKATGDMRLLRIALENLLGNAWKFTGKREKARIAFGSIEHDGKLAYFVRDNGNGFDMAYADKLFQPFQRLHSAAEFSGTGIGLATVQRIIHRHGGRIWAEGEVGKGATFYFTLSSTQSN